jgi:hypothetical protein
MIALSLVLVSTAAIAETWVVLRPPPETGASSAGILVDATSIEALGDGIRRAKVKVDFLSRRGLHETFGPNAVNFSSRVKSHDCDEQMTHKISMEAHLIDGSVHTLDSTSMPAWYPPPANRLADPTIDFVCGWNLLSVSAGN